MEIKSESPPKTPKSRKSGWLLGIAVLALAGMLFSFASLRSTPAGNSALPAALQSNPVATQLYAKLADAQSTKTQSVEIMNYQFQPSSLTISVGDTVTWTNHDSAPHNIVVSDGPEKFSGPTIQQGQSWSYTFTKAGTYQYYCGVHPDMKASITVTAGATSAPPTSSAAPAPPASSSPASSSSSSSMSMPSNPGAASGCVSKEMLSAFWAHIEGAHLEESPGQQVSDLLNLDSWVKLHTVWIDTVLKPLFNGQAQQVGADTLSAFWAHVEAAHLDESLGQQVSDLLNVDSWVKLHTVWLDTVLKPSVAQLTC